MLTVPFLGCLSDPRSYILQTVKEESKQRQTELEKKVCKSITTKLYESTGGQPGGMPGGLPGDRAPPPGLTTEV